MSTFTPSEDEYYHVSDEDYCRDEEYENDGADTATLRVTRCISSPIHSRFNLTVIRQEDRYGHPVYSVYSHGTALRVISSRTSRIVFVDAACTFVVKVDRGLAQAQNEADTWRELTPEHRQYFATPLEVGDGYIVQEFVPMDKSGDHPNAEAAIELAAEMWDRYMGWDEQCAWMQFGIDTRTGMLVIHDYPSGGCAYGHSFTTLAEVA
jgi:hypothetical protein